MNELWAQYAKWNKSDGERLILLDLTYIWNLGKQLIEKKIRFVVTRGGLWELGELDEGGQKLWNPNCKINSIGDIMYNMMSKVNTAVLYIWVV